jgi:hypothetical protein
MDAVPRPADTGKYDGVVPGSNAKNPLPAALGVGSHLIWTGFQLTATGSRVFLQTTEPVQFEVKEGHGAKGGKSLVVVVLRKCRIHMANNRRKIDTRFFATPVSGLSARQRRGDVEVHLALREAASVTPRSEAGPGGTQFLVMDFPPGKATTDLDPQRRSAADTTANDGISVEYGEFGAPVLPSAKDAKPAAKSRR